MMIFTSFSGLIMSMSFLSFIIRDPEYYNVKDVGSVTGDIGFYCELVMLLFDISYGPILDIVGRKGPLIVCLVLSGAALGMIPMFH